MTKGRSDFSESFAGPRLLLLGPVCWRDYSLRESSMQAFDALWSSPLPLGNTSSSLRDACAKERAGEDRGHV